MHSYIPSRRAALLSAATSLTVITSASAVVKTWEGAGNANWQTAANWNAGTAPLPGDSLVFQGTTNLANNNDFAAATRFTGLSFAAGAGAFTITGNAITLAGNVSNNSSNTQSLGTALALDRGSVTFTGSTTADAILALGTVAAPASAGGTAAFAPNAGTITTASTNTNGILGGWATVGTTTAGTNWATVNGSNEIVAYTAYTDVAAAATIPINPVSNVRLLGAANLGGASADINTLKSSAAGGTGGNDVTNIGAGNTLRFGTMGAILNDTGVGNNMRVGGNTGTTGIGTVTAGGPVLDTPGMLVLNAAKTTSDHANVIGILSTITNNGTGPVTIVKTGLASSYFQSANSYSGGTYINQGHIQGNAGTSFGTGPVYVAAGGQAFLNATATFANNIFITGTGLPQDNTGALRFSNATVTGNITLEGNSRVNLNGNATANVNGQITGPYSLDYYANGGANTTPNLVLGNTGNNWTGGTNIISGPNNGNTVNATLRLGAAEVIPHGASAGSVSLSATASSTTAKARIDLNGFSETINGLNSATGIRFEVTNLAAGPASLTLGSGNADGDFGGSIIDSSPANAISLVKTGAGTQILRGGTSAYYGTTAVNEGRLEFIGNVIADGALTVASGATLATNGSITGPVSVNGGYFVSTGTIAGAAQLTSLSLDAGSSIEVNTAAFPTVPITVAGPVSTTGAVDSVTINVTGGSPGVGFHPLISYAGSLGGTGFPAFTLGTLPPRTTAVLVDDTVAQAVVLNLISAGDSPVWTGSLSSEWSTGTLGAPKNWVLSSSPGTTTDFLPGDTVIFNDTASNNSVNISGEDLSPASVTFSNDDDTYVLTGSHGITGPALLTMDGSGTTVIANPNSYTGGTVLSSGTLQVGNGGTAGSLGTDVIANDGILIFNRSDSSSHPNVILGSGEVRHTGTGTTTLAGASEYDGATTVSSGTLRATNPGSFGSLGGSPVQVLSGAAIDIGGSATANTLDMPGKQFLISGNGPGGGGAIVNSGALNQQDAFTLVSLEADASVGGSGRFDIRGGTPELDLNGHTLRKRGSNQVSVVSGLIRDGGQIIVEQGTLALEAATGTEGSGSIAFEAGTQCAFFQNNLDNGGVDWPLTLREGVTLGNAGGNMATIPAPIILEGNATLVGYNGGIPVLNMNRPLTLTGSITENGGSYSVTKTGTSEVTLTGTSNTYTGATTISGGTLIVNGNITSSPVAVASGATLAGTGVLGGTMAGDGIVSPGMALTGTFTTGPATFSATGELAVQIDSGTLAADKLAVAGALNLGGAALTVTDLGAASLPVGTKFVIATHTGGVTGAFSNVADGGTLIVGVNTLAVDYDELVLGESSLTLTVAAGSAYDDWASTNGLDGGNNGKLDDPDHDGLENIVEFGIDGNPLGAGEGKIAALVSDVDPGAGVENAFVLTVPIRTGATFSGPGDLVSPAIDGIVYSIQGSTGLTDFTSIDVSEVAPALSGGLPAPSAGWTYRSFRLPGSPSAPHPKAFLRVGVAEPAP
jgi:fibronectin-binding autotransporter adhesin